MHDSHARSGSLADRLGGEEGIEDAHCGRLVAFQARD